jgi:hypothetical protein
MALQSENPSARKMRKCDHDKHRSQMRATSLKLFFVTTTATTTLT